MVKNKTLAVESVSVALLEYLDTDFISLTDMVRANESGSAIIDNWLRNKNTLEFLAVWEEIYNPGFNSLEFEGIKKEAGLNRFTMSEQLVAHSNLESLNAELIWQGLDQPARLTALNQIAIHQMRSLLGAPILKKLK